MKKQFWKDLIKYFTELKFRDELNIDSVIWHDSHLNLEGKIIFYREHFDKLAYLREISLMTTTHIKHLKKLKINKINFNN